MRLACGGEPLFDAEMQPNDGDLNAPAMQQCILQALSKAQFPPSIDGQDVIVHYPFVFKSQDAD